MRAATSSRRYATDPADPTQKTVWGDLAELDYRPPQQRQILGYFQELVRHYIGLGFGGFRCDAAYKVPAEVWRGLIADAKAADAEVVFCAENLGAPKEAVLALAGAGFDYLFNSVKWWDFESPWLLEQYEEFRRIAPSIGFPESHDTERLVTELRRRRHSGKADRAALPAGLCLRRSLFDRRHDADRASNTAGRGRSTWSSTRNDQPEPKRFDLGEFIAEVNAMKRSLPALNEEGPQRLLSNQDDPLLVLERRTERGDERALILVNTHEHEPRVVSLATLPVGQGVDLTDVSPGRS